MGACQCIEVLGHNSNEIVTEKYFLSGVFKNETDNNEDDNFIAKQVKNNKNIGSNFNNFRQNNPKANRNTYLNMINESIKSEILFEDFSYISRKTVESSLDYYQASKTMFEFINRIRMNPKKYVNSITSLINEFKNKETYKEEENVMNLKKSYNSHIINISGYANINEHIKNFLKEEGNLITLIDLRDSFLKTIDNVDKKTEFILWSEKVYLAAYEYLIEVEEKQNINKEYIKKSCSLRVSEKLKINCTCLEFNIDGSASPEVIIFFLLLENKERFKNILIDNYAYGGACMFPTKDGARTLFYFINKNNKQKITGMNPITGQNQDLSLDELVFSAIKYKHLIIDGRYKSDGEVFNVVFNLIDGRKKEELFVIS